MSQAVMELDDQLKVELPSEFKFLEDDIEFTDEIDELEVWHDIAMNSLGKYFATKSLYCGGPIPHRLIYTKRNITLVRDAYRIGHTGFAFEKMIDIFFSVLHRHHPLRFDPIDVDQPWDSATLIAIIKNVHKLNIPKECMPGLALLHLKICKGWSLPDAEIDALLDYVKSTSSVVFC